MALGFDPDPGVGGSATVTDVGESDDSPNLPLISSFTVKAAVLVGLVGLVVFGGGDD